MDDLISRSELIAQLEGFKLFLGDVILGNVVDRVIDHVKALPAAKMVIESFEFGPHGIRFNFADGSSRDVKL